MRRNSIIVCILVCLFVSSCGGAESISEADVEATVRSRVEETLSSQDSLSPPTSTPAVEDVADTPPVYEDTATVTLTATPEPSATPQPTYTPEAGERIVLSIYTRNGTTKIDGLAFANDIDLTIFERDKNGFLGEIRQPDVIAAIYAPSREPDAEILLQLESFVQNGGRVFMMYSHYWSEENSLLQDLYGVSIAEERVSPYDELILYDQDMLPSWMQDARLAAAGCCYNSMINGYLIVPGEIGEAKYVRSDKTSEERLVYFSSPDKGITFFPRVIYYPANSDPEDLDFFDDDNFDLADNEEATLLMLRFLLE